jgi:Domain of unknown function (DUF1906)
MRATERGVFVNPALNTFLYSRVLVEAAMFLALSVVGLVQPTVGEVSSAPAAAAVCSNAHGLQAECVSLGSDSVEVALPGGSSQCPGSGAGVTCSSTNPEAPDHGAVFTPDQMPACGAQLGSGSPDTVAACTDTVLAPRAMTSTASGRLELSATAAAVARGHNVTLTATSDNSVVGTGRSIEIFDTSTRSLIASCAQGSQCVVSYVARSGKHSFSAYLTSPTTKVPTASTVVASNEVQVNWIGVNLSADRSPVGPGRKITLTATSSVVVDRTGWQLQVYDVNSHARIAFCASGNVCRTSITSTSATSLAMVSMLAPPSATMPTGGVIARSDIFRATWLSVTVTSVTGDTKAGSVAHVVATVNADITGTGWSIGIFDDRGQLVGSTCNSGTACRADVAIGSSLPPFRGAIGSVPSPKGGLLDGIVRRIAPPAKMVDIQAQSPLVATTVRPKILWGVDSCKSLTFDPGATTGLYPQVASVLGAPDFWGRYLTYTVCPAISPAEIAAAHVRDMGLLPIYNDYDCSAVVGYDTGRQYGAEAVAAAHRLGIPAGVALAIDVEAPGAACPGAGNVDAGFVNGWYDGVTSANYVAAYYGNGTAGSPFAEAYCAAVSGRPEVGHNSHLWTYEPSLLGGFAKGSVPDWGLVANTQCSEHGTAWQFALSAGSDPDVDQDLVSSDFPLWYP